MWIVTGIQKQIKKQKIQSGSKAGFEEAECAAVLDITDQSRSFKKNMQTLRNGSIGIVVVLTKPVREKGGRSVSGVSYFRLQTVFRSVLALLGSISRRPKGWLTRWQEGIGSLTEPECLSSQFTTGREF